MARRVDGPAERHSTAVDARDMTRPQEREARHTQRLVEAVFARWVKVRRFRRAARDFLRARGLERRRTRQLARRCLRGWRARGRQALVLATPQQKHNRERSSRSLFSEDAIRRIHAPYT